MTERSKHICDAIARLMELSVTAKEKDGTDIFAEWQPHCNMIDVRIYLGGWKKDANGEGSRDLYIYLCDNFTETEAQNKITALLDEVNGYLGNDTAAIRAEYERLKGEADELGKRAQEAAEKARLYHERFVKETEEI